MDGRFRENSGQRLENESPGEHAQPEVDVEGDVDAFVNRPSLAPHHFAKETGGLLEVGPMEPVEGRLQCDLRRRYPRVPRTIGIDELARAHEDVTVRIG